MKSTHVIDCQMNYHPHLIEGFGRSTGEGVERLWSYLRKYITMTKEMDPDNRHFVLYMAVVYKNNLTKFNLRMKIPQFVYTSVLISLYCYIAQIVRKRCDDLLQNQFKVNGDMRDWSEEKKESVRARYLEKVEQLSSSGCKVKSRISALIPESYGDPVRYCLLLSVIARFQ